MVLFNAQSETFNEASEKTLLFTLMSSSDPDKVAWALEEMNFTEEDFPVVGALLPQEKIEAFLKRAPRQLATALTTKVTDRVFFNSLVQGDFDFQVKLRLPLNPLFNLEHAQILLSQTLTSDKQHGLLSSFLSSSDPQVQNYALDVLEKGFELNPMVFKLYANFATSPGIFKRMVNAVSAQKVDFVSSFFFLESFLPSSNIDGETLTQGLIDNPSLLGSKSIVRRLGLRALTSPEEAKLYVSLNDPRLEVILKEVKTFLTLLDETKEGKIVSVESWLGLIAGLDAQSLRKELLKFWPHDEPAIFDNLSASEFSSRLRFRVLEKLIETGDSEMEEFLPFVEFNLDSLVLLRRCSRDLSFELFEAFSDTPQNDLNEFSVFWEKMIYETSLTFLTEEKAVSLYRGFNMRNRMLLFSLASTLPVETVKDFCEQIRDLNYRPNPAFRRLQPNPLKIDDGLAEYLKDDKVLMSIFLHFSLYSRIDEEALNQVVRFASVKELQSLPGGSQVDPTGPLSAALNFLFDVLGKDRFIVAFKLFPAWEGTVDALINAVEELT